MKKILILTLICLSINGFSQEKSVNQLKKDAVDAIHKTDYNAALGFYEMAMPLTANTPDGELFYNAAFCAKKCNEDEKALKYFLEAETNCYKPSISAYNASLMYEKLGQLELMEKYLVASVAKYPKSKEVDLMKGKLVNYYLVEGTKPYNAGIEILNETHTSKAKIAKQVEDANMKFLEAKPFFENAAKYGDPADIRITIPLADINAKLAPKIY